MSDFRPALRRLRATPLVTASAIACLAIAVWMTCTMAALGRGFFRPNLRIPDGDRVVQLEARGLYALNPERSQFCCGRRSSLAVVDSLKASKLFAAVGYYDFGSVSFDDKLRKGAWLSHGMMGVLHVRPFLGRAFVPADDSSNSAVILSHHVWRTVYGADSSVIGRQLYLQRDARPLTIVGVMREDFMFPQSELRPDFYLPAHHPRAGRPRYPAVRMLGRLADDVRLADASQSVRDLAVRNLRASREEVLHYWRTVYPRRQRPELATGPIDVRLERYYNEPRGADEVRLLILIIACGLAVIAIAGANVVNLLLVRGAARRQEIAVRMALGGGRLRIVRDLLVETGLVAAAGIVIGYVIASWQWSRLDRGFSARHIFGEIDAWVAMTAVIAGALLTLVVGIWPGLRATSVGLEQVLRDSRRSGVTASPLDGLLGRMVAASTAGTVMLLICAVMLTLSARDSAGHYGLGNRNLLTATITFQEQSSKARVAAGREMLTRVRGLPDVVSASLGVVPPEGAQETLVITTPGRPESRHSGVGIYSVTDRYFGTLQIPLLYGREFSARETRDSTGAVIVNRLLAERLFPGRTAIGKRFRFRRGDDSASVDAIVIGVAEDIRGLSGKTAQLYMSLGSSAPAQTSALIRFRSQKRPNIVAALQSNDRFTATSVALVSERRRDIDSLRRYMGIGFTIFAVVALVLAAVGTYGIVAYSVVRRTHEIGVRIALGAPRSRVTWMIVEQGLKVSLVGLIGGLLLALGVTRLLGGFIQDVNMDYPLAICGVVTFVAVVSLVASSIPGYRAGRLNPVDAMRAD